MYDPSKSDLVGIPTATLQQWLLDSQQAMHDLMTGSKVVQVAYQQGDGQKMVTYKHPDISMLRGYIQELKAQLGITCGRRPLTPIFTSGRS
jgi:hypothetical protein